MKKKRTDYKRELSDALFGLTWDSKSFVVHHINHDHHDNRIQNLVLIPKKLHTIYHTDFNYLQACTTNIFDKSVDVNYPIYANVLK